MKQRVSLAHRSLIFVAPILIGGFLFLLPSAHASTIDVTSTITTNTTWIASNVYVVGNFIDVQSGVTLTIASGTVVKFNGTYTGLQIDGTLQANGASSKQIYFTSINDNSKGGTNASSTGHPAPGDWYAIQVDANATATITDAFIRYGGSGSYSPADYADVYTSGTLALSDSQVASSSREGLCITGDASTTVTSSTFSNNGQTSADNYGIVAGCNGNASGALTVTSSTFSHNFNGAGYINFGYGLQFTSSGNTASGTDAGFTVNGNISTSTTWTKDSIPYIINDVIVNPTSTLTINHGAVLKFTKNSGVLDVNGILNVNGTSTDQVYFTSIDDNSIDSGTSGSTTSTPNSSDWDQIKIEADATATITNAIIRYGGDAISGESYGELTATGTLALSNSQVASSSNNGLYITGAASTTVTSSTISSNGQYGINTDGVSGSLTVTSSSFSQNASGPADIEYGSGLQFSSSGNSASGTQAGFYINGNITASTTWDMDTIPYIVNYITIPSSTTLTVNPGAVLKFFNQGSELDDQGTLNINGTSTNEVYLTAYEDNSIDPGTNGTTTSNPSPGDWIGVEVDAPGTSTISNAIIRYGGYGSFSIPNYSNIYQTGGYLNLSNSQLASSSDFGIYESGGVGNVESSELAYNLYGISVASGTLGVVDSSIHDNSSDGVSNSTNVTSSAYAENNYWGASSGPYNASSNPSGTGDGVSNYVDFSNWLTSWASSTNPTPYMTSVAQYKSDAATPLQDGSSTTETTVVLGATLQSAGTSTLKLQVEVEPSGTSFTNTATSTSGSISPGSNATATYALYPESWSNGNYHWQARVVATNGDASLWQPYSANATNFTIDTVPLYTQQTSTYPSLSNSTGTGLWATAPYDDALPGTGCGQSTSTIEVCGCAITSVVMDLRYFGITTNASGTDVNPFTLNKWLASTTGGYDPEGNLNWTKVPLYSGSLVTYSNTGTVNSYLNGTTTIPVILYESSVPDGGTATTTHFIVASGFASNAGTSTYTLRDSYWYDTKYLNQATSSSDVHIQNYQNAYNAIDVFIPDTPGPYLIRRANLSADPSSDKLPLDVQYTVNLPNSLLLIDSDGRKTGRDASGIIYNEIPGASYQEQEQSGHLLIYTPPAGNYTIQIIGAQTGGYAFSNEVFDGQQDAVYQVLRGNINAGQTITYTQNYDRKNLASSTVVQD